MKPVLYAEDERDDVFFMQLAWEEARVPNPLLIVKDGQQALEYLAGRGAFADRAQFPLPGLLLLDLKLPIKSGFAVLEWLRQQPALADMKVVIVSGSELDADLAQARQLGVADYLVKPASPARLTEMVKERYRSWLGE